MDDLGIFPPRRAGDLAPREAAAEIIPPQPRADFTTGAGGQPRQAWQHMGEMGAPFLSGYGSASGLLGTGGARVSREGPLASAISLQLAFSDPVLRSIIDGKRTLTLGTGLTLSSTVDARKAGITDDQARDLATALENEWRLWSSTPAECDAFGLSTIDELAASAFLSWLITGEIVAVFPQRERRDAWSRSKVNLLDATQLDRTYTRSDASGNAIMGVHFSKAEQRAIGAWIRAINPGDAYVFAQPQFVPMATTWGRPVLLHVLDRLLPGQLRGVSPLLACLTPAKERNLLSEFALAATYTQTAFAAVVTSDLPPALAAGAMRTAEPTFSAGQPAGAGSPVNFALERAQYYLDNEIKIKPGVISFLKEGDKLEFKRPVTPNDTYKDQHDGLLRLAAKAAGLDFATVSGDYSKESFSASRLATEIPFRITLRERNFIIAPFYQAAYRCFVEEALETGVVSLPRGARPFWKCPAAYLGATWNGPGRIVADPYKQALADVMELNAGLATKREKLAERGKDFDTVQAEREREMHDDVRRGLDKYIATPGVVSTQTRHEDVQTEKAE